MPCCDDCGTIFIEPKLILYQDPDAYISQHILVCPRCFSPNFYDIESENKIKGSD